MDVRDVSSEVKGSGDAIFVWHSRLNAASCVVAASIPAAPVEAPTPATAANDVAAPLSSTLVLFVISVTFCLKALSSEPSPL